MSTPIIEGDFTGDAEIEWVLAQLGTLAGGRVFETAVPDDVDLDRITDGGVKPYIVAKFATPMASSIGRNIGSHEQGQPHILTATIFVIGNSADAVRQLAQKVRRLIIGQRPSLTSGEIQSRGGFSFPQTESGSVPSRYEQAVYARVYINL